MVFLGRMHQVTFLLVFVLTNVFAQQNIFSNILLCMAKHGMFLSITCCTSVVYLFL